MGTAVPVLANRGVLVSEVSSDWPVSLGLDQWLLLVLPQPATPTTPFIVLALITGWLPISPASNRSPSLRGRVKGHMGGSNYQLSSHTLFENTRVEVDIMAFNGLIGDFNHQWFAFGGGGVGEGAGLYERKTSDIIKGLWDTARAEQ